MRQAITWWIVLLMASPATAQTWPDLTRPAEAVGGGDKDAALIVSIEDYVYLPQIKGASANGKAWYLWLTRTRQVRPAAVRWVRDRRARKESLVREAEKVAGLVKPGGTLWFVFIGHGAPSLNQRDGVLVGVDADQSADGLYDRSLPKSAVLSALRAGPQVRTVAVIDACFSGKSATGAQLVPGLQPVLNTTLRRAGLGTTLLMAGSGDQFAGPLPNAAQPRPAFSYLVLGALRGWGDRNQDGAITAQEVVNYANEVLLTLLSDRQQTPELAGPAGDILARPGEKREEPPDLIAFKLGRAVASPVGSGISPVLVWGLGLAGGAAVAAAVGVTVAANAEDGDVQSANERNDAASAHSAADRVQVLDTVAYSLYGVGGALVVTALVLELTRGPDNEQAVAAWPVFFGGGALLGVRGSF